MTYVWIQFSPISFAVLNTLSQSDGGTLYCRFGVTSSILHHVSACNLDVHLRTEMILLCIVSKLVGVLAITAVSSILKKRTGCRNTAHVPANNE